jgi:hypothetical protein
MGEPLEHYLDRLRVELRRNGLPDRLARRVVAECSFHLHSACEELEAAGLDRQEAVREALARFGAAALLARDWAAAERSAPPRWCWVAVCSLGLCVGLAASLPVGRWVEAALGMLLILPSMGLVTGVVLGLSQGWALRQRLGWLLRWVLGTALGLSVGLTAGTTLVEGLGLERGRPFEELVGLLLIGGVVGSVLALAQWQLARRELVGSLPWVAGHGLGAGAGLACGSLTAHLLGAAAGPLGLVLTLVGGAAGVGWAGSRGLDRLLAGGRSVG